MSSRPLNRGDLLYTRNARTCRQAILDFAWCNHKYVSPFCSHASCEELREWYVPGMIDDSQRHWQNANFYRIFKEQKCKDCEVRDADITFKAKRDIYQNQLNSGKELLHPDVVEAGESWARAKKVLDTALKSIQQRYPENMDDWEWVQTYYGQSVPACQTPSPERLLEPKSFMPRW